MFALLIVLNILWSFFRAPVALSDGTTLGEALSLEPLFVDYHTSVNNESILDLFLGNLLEGVPWGWPRSFAPPFHMAS